MFLDEPSTKYSLTYKRCCDEKQGSLMIVQGAQEIALQNQRFINKHL